MPRRVPTLAVIALVAGTMSLSACSESASQSGTHAAIQTYSCCSLSDINAIRHPGDTIAIHWKISTSNPAATGQVSTVTLTAGLAGNFSTVSDLKAADGPRTVEAPIIVTTDQVGNTPISIITIPKNAAPGYYNMSTTVALDGGKITGGSIIEVTLSD